MTPEQENALIKECCPFEGFAPKWADIRLAIRAAVAQERERCAKVCEEQEADISMYGNEFAGPYNGACSECAAAIRRGE